MIKVENNISGKNKVFGLIGSPVEHSFSPILQNTVAETLKFKNTYVNFLVQKENLKSAIDGAMALNISGLNVTFPHKQEVINYLFDIHETAKKLNSVNT